MNFCEESKQPKYLFDKEKNCGIIHYNGKKYYMNLEDRDDIINFHKKFTFYNENDLYPYYHYNEQKINYLMFLYNFKENNVDYVFKNNDPFDLRRSNVVCFHIFHKKGLCLYHCIPQDGTNLNLLRRSLNHLKYLTYFLGSFHIP